MGFIKSIEIENFHSIKNNVYVEFKAKSYLEEFHNERLKSGHTLINAIYGANASGKSSILRAITLVSNIIINESDDKFKFPSSFKNKFNDKRKKTKIVLNFCVNEVYYSYEVILKSQEYKNIGIENEILYKYTDEKEVFFDRKKKFIHGIENNIKKPIFEKLENSKSLVYEFFKFNDELETIINFFRPVKYTTNILNPYLTNTVPSKGRLETAMEHFLPQEEIFGLKEFLIKFLNSIGLDFENFRPNYKEDENGKKLLDSIFIKHKISKTKELELLLESDGTLNLIQILINTFLVKMQDTILIIDELDSILHPMLVPIINKLMIDNNVQLIYTTHNIYNMKYLYHDEVTLIEKDSEHNTSIRQLKNEKDIDFTENILDLYEEGYFGGIPDIKEIYTKISI